MERMRCLGPFPSLDSRCAVARDVPVLFESGCWSKTQYGDVSSAVSISLFF